MKPIRCYTCGKVLGNKWILVDRLTKEGKPIKEIYDVIGITRYCCKRIVLCSVDDSGMETYNIGTNIKIHRHADNSSFIKIT